MANRDIIEIFDECVNRLAAGEDIDTILRLFPAEAERLRGLLETGLLVYQAQKNTPGVEAAQIRGRGRLEEAMNELPEIHDNDEEKPKRRRRPVQWLGFAAAAVFALFLGIGIGIGSGLGARMNSPFAMTTTVIAGTNAYVAMLLTETSAASHEGIYFTATALVQEATGTAGASLMTTATMTATGTPLPTMTAFPTLGPLSTSVGSFAAMTATPGAGAYDVVMTATALSEILVTAVPATPGPEYSVGGTGGDSVGAGAPLAEVPGMPGVVVTSTASYLPVTPEMGGGDELRERDEETEAGAAGYTTADTGVVVVPPAQPTALPDFSQVQLQPLKAGEIDDNADWDTYTLYRRNFLELYSGLVIDVDITGRQVIKVVDGSGRPILGATVQVYYGTQLISETRTYATGMTLFFPNAKPEFQRMDTFRVVVSKNGVTTEATLDIERIDDILTITLR